MRVCIVFLSLLFFISCNNHSDDPRIEDENLPMEADSSLIPAAPVWDTAVPVLNPRTNAIFQQVNVDRIGPDSFRIWGQARVHEANVRWVIEDGHNELATGFTTATAGAPEWGNFDFSVAAPKENENTTLHIILFEENMKDGNRNNRMPIYLY